jgi:hypothetical protein
MFHYFVLWLYQCTCCVNVHTIIHEAPEIETDRKHGGRHPLIGPEITVLTALTLCAREHIAFGLDIGPKSPNREARNSTYRDASNMRLYRITDPSHSTARRVQAARIGRRSYQDLYFLPPKFSPSERCHSQQGSMTLLPNVPRPNAHILVLANRGGCVVEESKIVPRYGARQPGVGDPSYVKVSQAAHFLRR